MIGAPTVGSVYSGAGGLDLGFSDAGFDLRWAVDADPNAVTTFQSNLHSHSVNSAIGEGMHWEPPSCVDMLIGGPPCQGFSVAGHMRPDDERSQHVFYFLDLASKLNVVAFVMENVPALALNRRWRDVMWGLREKASGFGFDTETWMLNSSDFGVAQSRQRMFFIGWNPKLMSARPVEPRGTGIQRSVREALLAIPRYGQFGNSTGGEASVVPAKNPVLRKSPFSGMLFNGKGRPVDLDGLCPTLPASMGGNRSPIMDQQWLDHPTARPWVSEYHHHLVNGGKPLASVPDFVRRVTVEEASILQGFPTDWSFTGPTSSRFRQIGNSVPPPLANAVAGAVKTAFSGEGTDQPEINPTGEGQLRLV